MIEVLDLFIINRSSDSDYFSSYKIGRIQSWIYINIGDFYNWLKQNIPDYYNELRSRHFFFSKKSIVEDYRGNNPDRKLKAKYALDRYLKRCYENNGLQNFDKMVDLQNMSPLFRDVQLLFVNSMKFQPMISIIKGYGGLYGTGGEADVFFKKYGSTWVDDLLNEGKKYNLRFFNDGAGHLYPDYNFRTLFYDSGSTREMQFDRTVGRENTNSVK